MNHALSPLAGTLEDATTSSEELAHLRRLRALLGLFALYATALMMVMLLSDGADVGCILAGIAGHVFYATHRIVTSWRDASWLLARREDARLRALFRARAV
jgi:hypothetical protein